MHTRALKAAPAYPPAPMSCIRSKNDLWLVALQPGARLRARRLPACSSSACCVLLRHHSGSPHRIVCIFVACCALCDSAEKRQRVRLRDARCKESWVKRGAMQRRRPLLPCCSRAFLVAPPLLLRPSTPPLELLADRHCGVQSAHWNTRQRCAAAAYERRRQHDTRALLALRSRPAGRVRIAACH